MKTTNDQNQKDEKRDQKKGKLELCLFLGFETNRGPRQSGMEGEKITAINTENGTKTEGKTDKSGCVEIPLECGTYCIELPSLLYPSWKWECSCMDIKKVKIHDCKTTKIECYIPAEQTGIALNIFASGDNCLPVRCSHIDRGKAIFAQLTVPNELASIAEAITLFLNGRTVESRISQDGQFINRTTIPQSTTNLKGSRALISALLPGNSGDGSQARLEDDLPIAPNEQIIGGQVSTTTSMTRTETSFTEDTAFWTAIRNSTDALSFNNYLSFMDWIFCGGKLPTLRFEANRFHVKHFEYGKLLQKRFLSFTDADTYRVVKAATEAFVMVNCGVLPHNDLDTFADLDLQPFDPDRDTAYLDRRDLPGPPNGLNLSDTFNGNYLVGVEGNGNVLPYLAVIRRKLPDIPIKSGAFEDASPYDNKLDNCFGLLQEKLANPCLLELIWSYWHEEGMLVQTMNALSRRFQNIRSSAQDPLANLEMDPLRPLNNLLWSYIQDEQHRLTISRRNYEYDHHYGLRLEGKAVQDFRPVDTRSKFLEAFHHLLRLCTVFYKQDDDTTVKADAFPVLNALKEVHLILSQGAHNQFGDLPSTARIEMLMQQWLLARPEFRELLPTRIMVAYPEPWMDRVDAMKKLQGWTDTSVLHFRNLGMFGEQLLLSIRWGHWSDEFEPVKALNWARFFRPQVQGYIHAYRAATGVDLSADPTVNARVDSTLPSVLLQKRLASQQRAS